MRFTHDHHHFRCQDHQAAAQWYLDMFDGEDLGQVEAMGMPIRRVKVAGQTWSFSPKRDDVTMQGDGLAPHYGYYQIGLGVEDLDQAVKRLSAKGGVFRGGIHQLSDTLRVAFMEAPDGMEIELLERK